MDSDFYMFQSAIAERGQTEQGVVAQFYDKQVMTDDFDDNGMPIYKNVTYVRIRVRDNSDVYDQPACDENFNRFPVEYNRYLSSKKQMEKGTPLNQFAFLGSAQIETCNSHGVFTVEALASLTEEQAKDIQLLNEVNLAQEFLDFSKNNKTIADFAKKEKKYKAEIARLKDEIKLLKSKGE